MPVDEDIAHKIKNLKFARRTLKSHLTRVETYFESLNKDELSQTDQFQLENKLRKIEPLFERFNEVQLEIEILIDKEETEERNAFETKYFEIIAAIESLLNTIKSDQEQQAIGNVTESNSSSSVPTQMNQRVKLPVIQLPSFYGEYSQWLDFRDLFHSLIDQNDSLSNVQKLHYLKASVKGNASSILSSIHITADGYKIAWDLLNERYSNKRVIVQDHVSKLFELPVVKKESHVDLRNLLDGVFKNLRALENLGEPIEYWDTLLIHIMCSKFDNSTRKEWQQFDIKGEIPKFEEIKDFIQKRCHVLEAIACSNPKENYNQREKQAASFKRLSHAAVSGAATTQVCSICKGEHYVQNCTDFLSYAIEKRHETVSKLRLCFNCLKFGHQVHDCKLRMRCTQCNGKHHYLLCQRGVSNTNESSANNMTATAQIQEIENTIVSHSVNRMKQNVAVLLSTAIVTLKGRNSVLKVRALLDSGSQSSFISEKLASCLGLPFLKCNSNIVGINRATTQVNKKLNVPVESLKKDFSCNISCLILPHITASLPRLKLKNYLNIPKFITLADPEFEKGGEIDLLIGSDYFWILMGTNHIPLGTDMPMLHETKFGYILAGTVDTIEPMNSVISNVSVDRNERLGDLDKRLESFWKVEHVEYEDKKNKFTCEEQICENHFVKTHSRNEEGRFVVKMPLNEKISNLGESRTSAIKRFTNIEKRFIGNKELKNEYEKFMENYIELGHMVEISTENLDSLQNYYLPHHAVFKREGNERKIRVVFDGSQKTSTGISLNETQLVGPTIQEDLFSILTRFRKYNYVLKADINKMYRQVLMHKDFRRFQHIFWRSDSTQELKEYELCTVTYGQACAPFLAIRCLQQLAEEMEKEHPKIAHILKTCFYVDDLLCGASTIEEVMHIKKVLTNALEQGGFILRKWASNEPTIVQSNKDLQLVNLENEDGKTLGIAWNANLDVIQYSIRLPHDDEPVTKRGILSTISSFFDPLGIIGPVLITGKILMQMLWSRRLGWDEEVPEDLQVIWKNYYEELQFINDVQVNRQVTSNDTVYTEVHGFCDASESAFGACVYIRCRNKDGTFQSNLVCAKSRVAPVKTISIPRLELCGAVLLAKLMKKTKAALEMCINKEFYWSDSTVALHWIKDTSRHWKTFVSNRVSIIHNLSNVHDWHHVSSENNPADVISRGVSPRQLNESRLWFNGPAYLEEHEEMWPPTKFSVADQKPVEYKDIACVGITPPEFDVIDKFSNLNTLISVFCYVLRFAENARKLTNKRVGVLTAEERKNALKKLITIVQKQEFNKELTSLESQKIISKKSSLVSLCPFMDESKILRVGGRLSKSNLTYGHQHPILLPKKHPLTTLIMKNEHIRLLHCGPLMLLATIRQKYWPISGKSLAKKIVQNCVRCSRVKPKTYQYFMGELPHVRVTPSRPFSNCGTDFAGPFLIKDRKTRGHKLVKIYICIFVCFATKACHLELVSDLTTESFLSTFRRFIARRGLCSNIYSDNGTNYVGANNELKQLYVELKKNEDYFQTYFAKSEIQWHFAPARSPHFGGIYESVVKSTKYHLKRVVGETKLSQEEFGTVLTEIEACLNSRPLSPLSDDPNDISPLTPAHFLFGGPPMAHPEEDLTNIAENRLSRWQRVQQITQHFWRRWTREYLHQLQQRHKWNAVPTQSPQIGDLVIIWTDNTPPLSWPMGRIQKLYPGDDKIVRVVDVKTSRGVVKRAISRLCPLPK